MNRNWTDNQKWMGGGLVLLLVALLLFAAFRLGGSTVNAANDETGTSQDAPAAPQWAPKAWELLKELEITAFGKEQACNTDEEEQACYERRAKAINDKLAALTSENADLKKKVEDCLSYTGHWDKWNKKHCPNGCGGNRHQQAPDPTKTAESNPNPQPNPGGGTNSLSDLFNDWSFEVNPQAEASVGDVAPHQEVGAVTQTTGPITQTQSNNQTVSVAPQTQTVSWGDITVVVENYIDFDTTVEIWWIDGGLHIRKPGWMPMSTICDEIWGYWLDLPVSERDPRLFTIIVKNCPNCRVYLDWFWALPAGERDSALLAVLIQWCPDEPETPDPHPSASPTPLPTNLPPPTTVACPSPAIHKLSGENCHVVTLTQPVYVCLERTTMPGPTDPRPFTENCWIDMDGFTNLILVGEGQIGAFPPGTSRECILWDLTHTPAGSDPGGHIERRNASMGAGYIGMLPGGESDARRLGLIQDSCPPAVPTPPPPPPGPLVCVANGPTAVTGAFTIPNDKRWHVEMYLDDVENQEWSHVLEPSVSKTVKADAHVQRWAYDASKYSNADVTECARQHKERRNRMGKPHDWADQPTLDRVFQ